MPLPVLVAGFADAVVLTAEGELLRLSHAAALAHLETGEPPLLLHAPSIWRRLGVPPRRAYDLLELFAFAHPARTPPPTAGGLALELELEPPAGMEEEAALLGDMAGLLLRRLAAGRDLPINRQAAALAARMGVAGWSWAPSVTAALGGHAGRIDNAPMRVWQDLPEWEETAPPPPPDAHPVTPSEARARLAEMLGARAEPRPGQADYTSACCAAFEPRERRGEPNVVLAEAGTGTGKTLGYLAPASLWAERNGGAVWISTYTRHLQRQIDGEVRRLGWSAAERRRRVVVRKGRENYLCLLNHEDLVRAAGDGASPLAVPLGLVSRWARATEDGDLGGGDMPGWFAELFAPFALSRLADRRGECIHAACPHYKTCFVEHTIRRARGAQLVVANHALVMAQAAWGGLDEAGVPGRYVFDEGHHLFDAADSAFSAVISGLEGGELRRWLLGGEGGTSRARGLRRRMEEMLIDRPALQAALEAALHAARVLPGFGWTERLEADTAQPFELFLRALRGQVLARLSAMPEGGPQGGECGLHPVSAGLLAAAAELARGLAALIEPLKRLEAGLAALLEDEGEGLDAALRNRTEALLHGVRRRCLDRLAAWRDMLGVVGAPPPEPGERPDWVHYLSLDQREGRVRDAGLHRHPLDPTLPFIASLAPAAQGMVITSATLRDGGERDGERAWLEAERRTGMEHLAAPAIRAAVASPFDYAAQTRCFVLTDVAPTPEALAGALRALFVASGGGGLGLFTAIHRLRAAQRRLAPALAEAGLPLLAQHCDAMDNRSLVDAFRADPHACLLGTDAMRDGVDVPGAALRLVAFDRVPWPRPDILHRERRTHLSGGDPNGYDDRIVRLRLRQAFGRLVRRADDRGVFVLLDRRAPSRLLSAFPAGVVVKRVGLAVAVGEVRGFLGADETSRGTYGVPGGMNPE